MARILLVRHGKAAAGFDGHADPGLDPLGVTQAQLVADRLAGDAPMALRSSPLARARETAEPLAAAWAAEVAIEARLAEIPSPTDDLAERTAWLRRAMTGTWSDLGGRWTEWRDTLLDCLRGIETDTVIFSHFVAINAAVGHCEDSDALVVFRPDNGSITELAVHDGVLSLIERGAEADTEVR
jgi:broad specificity phosphatase PhoE